MAPELMVYFNLSPQQLGNLSAMYFYGTVIFLFPAGILLDRFSVRILLLLATVFCVIATAIFSFTSHFWIAAIARFVVGMMASFAIVSCVKLASRWFTTPHMAVVMGLCVTIAMLGGVLAQAPFVWLMNTLGWQQTLLCNLGLGGGVSGCLSIPMIIRFSLNKELWDRKCVFGQPLGRWLRINQTGSLDFIPA
ncbi:MFS transporter [Shewanella surugensis]|uniref:Lysosomal dipeptide transporter MFSD1 n=2 Tax=Shewanella surugensis TaxID=212020 RepID=A0ABT0LFI0_9GAMM|nr:MFS transporter [Shewanella surugensis]